MDGEGNFGSRDGDDPAAMAAKWESEGASRNHLVDLDGAKAGKPVAKVVPLDAPSPGEVRRLGFLAGRVKVPDDFDRMGEEEIGRLFGVTE